VNALLWVLQILIGLFFALASGLPKFILPEEALAANMPIPVARPLLMLIGLVEILGGLGLILPPLLRRYTALTPLAGAGLVLVTVGATLYQLAAGQPGNAVFAIVLGLLTAFVAYGRWRLVPHRDRANPPAQALER
jgi:hypothetical protein